MLSKIEARTSQGSLLTLELADISDGLLLADVEGLDPVKATIVESSFALLDGAQYHSSKREPRDIKLTIELRPDFGLTTVRALRSQLYGFFMPKREIFLRFYLLDGLTVNIAGRVETCEASIFSKDPAVDISIRCFDPDFVDVATQLIEGSTVSDTTETTFTYDGTVEAGIVFVLNLDRTETEFTIYHRPPDGTLRQMDVAASMLSGDVVTISTIPGAKGATLLRSGTTSSILYGVTPQSNWVELDQGTNTLRIYATGAAIPFTVSYMNRYGGL